MSRAPAARVLVDLSHAADGYVGVAQDLRLIFGMLAGLNDIDVSGLLMPTARHDLPRRDGILDLLQHEGGKHAENLQRDPVGIFRESMQQ